jgi:hypothetical protein
VSPQRILVPLTYGLSVRYAVATGLLEQLAEVATPVVGLGWDDPALASHLEAAGFEVVRLPGATISHAYRNHAHRLDLLHQRLLASPTTRIRAARRKRHGLNKARFVEDARIVRDRVALARPDAAERTRAADDSMLTAETNVAAFVELSDELGIDAVLSFTPYHDQDTLLLVAARRRGSPALVSVISFDNPTIRGRMPVTPDRVLVWNAQNADQIDRSHPHIPTSDIRVVGAPQFDLHRRADLVMDDASWREAIGLPLDQPILLYGAGPRLLVPNEEGLVDVIDRAISDGRIPGSPHVLLRHHPVDPTEPWARLASRWDHVTIATPWASGQAPKSSWPSTEDLRLQMSSLAHSAVHINVCSSMTVDGAVFDRPQIGPTFVPGASRRHQRFVRSFYRQEHWQPIERSGGLVLAHDEAQLVDAVRDALDAPDGLRRQRADLVEGVLTWADGRSCERLVAEVARALDAGEDQPGGAATRSAPTG